MRPEERLDEAAKQIEIVRETETLTDAELRWLNDAIRNVGAVEAIIEAGRMEDDNE